MLNWLLLIASFSSMIRLERIRTEPIYLPNMLSFQYELSSEFYRILGFLLKWYSLCCQFPMGTNYLKRLEYELKLRRYSPNTINHYWCHLRRFLEFYKVSVKNAVTDWHPSRCRHFWRLLLSEFLPGYSYDLCAF